MGVIYQIGFNDFKGGIMELNFEHWITSHWGDDELSRYALYDYLKNTYSELGARRLFPVWEDIYTYYSALKQMDEGLDDLLNLSPAELKGISGSGNLIYEYGHDLGRETLLKLKERIHLARPLVKKACRNSEALRKEHMEGLVLEPIGIWVQNTREGVLLLRNTGSQEVWSWKFSSGIQKNKFTHTSIDTRLLGRFVLSLSHTIHDVKKQSLKLAGFEHAVVSSWYGESSVTLPVFQTLKPLGLFRLLETMDQTA